MMLKDKTVGGGIIRESVGGVPALRNCLEALGTSTAGVSIISAFDFSVN